MHENVYETSIPAENILHGLAPPLNKDIILKALKRDQDKVLNPRIEPFTSVTNAYDSLIPYHIFISPTYDDLIYSSVNRVPDIQDMTETLDSLTKILCTEEDSFNELTVMEERLKVEEERYYLNKTINYKETKIKEIKQRFIR
ncbi:hypothetical protein NEPAR06_1483 [Nematocida parisii]|uniref:GLTSCR protein conserved domain-containing protein n=1 Tax=Nematocida parisii (strain ERTm3) TaxID=935791 RepID=I3EIR3_NEMP3|nr:uncharacterized protein NEPG_01679 [Nematocida parisii ERTm1]EIJ89110.1 hypothetical protein NEQG_00929 [Nematocida parisii ERTm3]KAI5125912.1 hypothetical protein NEPAR08_0248 [Nematocida parisii]KAI5166632.1 hypothetical protein NEIRO02_1289 [Nematocida sp. AWRm79]KAI5183633.1 hypothetical protein NEIRO03_1213 [Nematocida sp. AWRm78]OAG33521.1 hypothetical protein NEIG_02034 [Nematocida sp. ERTm5]|eukprot:XP_013059507.1 hypothetical protein NEPG_01679 [Nematocida parisii ERTm1]